MEVWTFIQDQVLGMHWLNRLIGTGLTALGLDVAEALLTKGACSGLQPSKKCLHF